MLRKTSLCLFLLAVPEVWAQPSGPIIRDLGDRYYLVQCNAASLRPDDPVVVMRDGREVGVGTVMRQAGSQCSIRLQSGQVARYDLVVLRRSAAPVSDRGPELPQVPGGGGSGARASAPSASASSGYFSSFSSAGSVYNLNTGEYLLKP